MAKPIKDIEKEVIQILADKLDLDAKKIKPESKLSEDLGLDSFMAVELNYELKENFGIDIAQEEFINIRTVEEVVKLVSKRK